MSCDALLSEKLTLLSEGFLAVELLCNFFIGVAFGTWSVLDFAFESLLILQSESSVSACCIDTTTSGSAAASIVCDPPLCEITVVASMENSLSASTFLVRLAAGTKHLFSDLNTRLNEYNFFFSL